MAYARELFDNGGFNFFYGNPFDPDINSPRIYFQIQTLILACILRISGWDPGFVFVGFGLIVAIICARVAVALYEEVVGLDSWPKMLGLVAFFWGGGLLVLAGIAYTLFIGGTFKNIFLFDPGTGWWFLNFGRNLILPTEAFYHALFLGSIYFILKGQYGRAAILVFALSFSHHFTAGELLSILIVWTSFEKYFLDNKEIPEYFLLLLLITLLFFILYYIIFLNFFEGHQIISKQLKIDWTYKAENFIPAYIIVIVLALWNAKRTGLSSFLSQSSNRLFFIWFLVAFVIANHEFAFRPIQPLHFTRGYIWMPLFLLGAGAIVRIFQTILTKLNRFFCLMLIPLILILFCFDNVIWFSHFVIVKDSNGIILNSQQKELLDFMALNANHDALVLTESVSTSYLATVYTPLRSWYSHGLTTPNYSFHVNDINNLFKHGKFLNVWEDMPLLIIMYRQDDALKRHLWLAQRNAVLVFQNLHYTVYSIMPKT